MPLRSRAAARAKERGRGRYGPPPKPIRVRRIPGRTERRAKSIREPRSVVLWYQLQLRRVASEFARIVRPAAMAIAERVGVRADAADGGTTKFPARVRADAKAKAKSIVSEAAPESGKRLERHSRSEFARLGIRLREAEPKLGPLIEQFRRENVDKIQSLVGSELDRIEQLLADGEGRRVESLAKDIEDRFDVTASKAELLARDQTLKLNAAITQSRHEAAGITKYYWTDSNDERVREMHHDLDGQLFSYDDPPVTNKQGDRNNPGEDYQCRCTASPYLPELEANQEEPEADAAE